MSNFSLGFKTQIINSNTQHTARFFKLKANGNGYEFLGTSDDYTGNPATAGTNAALLAAADRVVIDGFVTLDKGKIKNAIGAKGVPGQKPAITLTVATNAVTELSQFNLKLTLRSQNFDSELARWDSNYERTFHYPLIVKPGEAPAAVIARLKAAIETDTFQDRPYFRITADTATTLSLTTQAPAHEIIASAEGDAVTAGKVAVSYAVTAIGYEGRNNYDTLKGYRVETEATLQPLNPNDIQRQGLPLQGKLYTSITMEKDVERPELHGSTMTNGTQFGDYAFELYINQELTQYLLALTSWINANVASRRFYPATTPALATASPETVQSFSTVAAAPFTSGLS